MNISLGARIQPGPYGGGNQFARLLVEKLEECGHRVVCQLRPPDLDFIVLMEPRPLKFSAYTDRHIFAYLARHPQTLVVHRVNECDERKGTRGVNARLARANLCADHTVFVSAWLRDLHLARGWPCGSVSVILNGSDRRLFHADGHARWDGRGPLKLVTHHWGGHWNKGFDVYQRLDRMLAEPAWEGRIEFTYVGNVPAGFTFEHARHVAPLSGPPLADVLREQHVYVTASRGEPGSNHQNEGALCGLPLLYLRSGSLPEYCDGYGIAFEPDEFEARLSEMMATYPRWAAAAQGYPHDAERVTADWLGLFGDLQARRAALLAARPAGRWVGWAGRALLAGIRRHG